MRLPVITEVEPRTVLTRQRGPGHSFTLNPYAGCVLGCVYCYVPHLRHRRSEPRPWGSYVDIKRGLAERLDRELARLKQPAAVFMSTATDPYQPVEEDAQITRSVLEVFAQHPRHSLRLLTKSTLFLRDLELFTRLKRFRLGVSISTFNDKLARSIEAWAAPPAERLAALGQAASCQIPTFVLWAPMIVPARDTVEAVHTLLAQVKAEGIGRVGLDRVNYLAELPPLRRIELMGERFATAQDERLVEAAISAAGLDAAFDEPPPEPGPGTPLLPF